MDGVRLALGFVFPFVVNQILNGLGLVVDRTAILIGAFILGLTTPSIVSAVLRRKAAPLVRTTTERFRLTVSRTEFVMEGERAQRVAIPLAMIARFDGAERLTVHSKDGRAVTLVCGLQTKSQQLLAATLNQLVASATPPA